MKVGRLGVGGSFYGWSCQFMNLSFCGAAARQYRGHLVQLAREPVGGARARRAHADAAVQDRRLSDQSGLSGGSERSGPKPQGHDRRAHSAEVDWSPKLGDERLPGTYVIGGWQDTANQPDVFLAANYQPLVLNPGLPPLERSGEHGFYLNGQQQVTSVDGDVSRGISLFVNYVHADPNTAQVSELFSVGLLFPGAVREAPTRSVRFRRRWTQVNPRVADGQELQNAQGSVAPVPVQHAEYPFEVFYTVNATRWLSLAPVLQYIRRPGGTSANRDVVVVGFNFGVTF